MSLLKAIILFHLQYMILAIYAKRCSWFTFAICMYSGTTKQHLVSSSAFNLKFFPSLAPQTPLLSITSGSSWLYVEWTAQSATFRVLYRESGAPDYQVIVPTTSQLSHNISALQPNTLYNIVVEATHTALQDKVNSSVTRAYITPQGELESVHAHIYFVVITLK